MKQHITNNQLHDLILPNGEWDDKAIDKCYRVLKLPNDKILSPRLFTIGKMIEILGNKINGISLPYNGIGCEVFLYEVPSISKDNLCDALWEAVKKVIE